MAKIGRPRKGNTQFALRLSPDLLEWIRETAKREGRTYSAQIEWCIRQAKEGAK